MDPFNFNDEDFGNPPIRELNRRENNRGGNARNNRANRRHAPRRGGYRRENQQANNDQNAPGERRRNDNRRGRGRGRGRGQNRNHGQENIMNENQAIGNNQQNENEVMVLNMPREGARRNPILGYKKLEEWSLNDNPDDLVYEVSRYRKQLEGLLNKGDMKEDWVELIIKVFGKLCKGRRSENKNALINVLNGSTFLKSAIRDQLVKWQFLNTRKNLDVILENLIEIFGVFLQIFPTNCLDLPLENLKAFAEDKVAIYEMDKMQALFDARAQSLSAISGDSKGNRQSSKKRQMHDEPPECYREISTIPERADILNEMPFYRPIQRNGSYKDGGQYLDIQFRLLREDLISPLREGMLEIINGIPTIERKHRVKIYSEVKYMYAECTKNGMIHKIGFDSSNKRGVPWKHSRKLLFGSLLCFTKDEFNTFIFATVANREVKELEKGILSIRLDSSEDVRYLQNSKVLTMIESASYFEAYKHVLDALKEIDDDEIPMASYIVECDTKIAPPEYISNGFYRNDLYDLEDSLGIRKDVKSQVAILSEKSWPDYSDTDLNNSQLTAFKHALTKEFVLIQGPPGTGKTHVGLRIAHALLKNKGERTEPMLIVCYTNHALDQFLLGLIELGHRNLIRVGGRCDEKLKDYNLRNKARRLLTQNRDRNKSEQDEEFKEIKLIRQAKHIPFTERNDYIYSLTATIAKSKHAETTLHEGKFLSYEEMKDSIPEIQRGYLQPYDQLCQPLGISVFDIYLNIINLPPDTLYDIERSIRVATEHDIANTNENNEDHDSENDENNIDVEGEGDRLVDLYVLDENIYNTNIARGKGKVQNETKLTPVIKLVDKDNFEYNLPKKKQRQNVFRRQYYKSEMMPKEEAENILDPWQLDYASRWRLYKFWVFEHKGVHLNDFEDELDRFERCCLQVQEFEEKEDSIILKRSDIIAMTTTGAARYRNVLQEIQPKVVIVEEAAEVLESHVITSLNTSIQHLILIGDHQQLQPSPSVFNLAKNFGLDISLFERMIINDVECHTLDVQHRMRPEISMYMHHIYKKLKDHNSVKTFPNIKGISTNVSFIHLESEENEIEEMRSKANKEEALFIRALCLYLIQNGYEAKEITILSGYSGQVIQFKRIMEKELFNGVRVTSVDNYQGEENRIILLSLVRSKKIGFWKTDNRICVALSRAKEGLYVVGNFRLFVQESDLWRNIIKQAISEEQFTKKLLLCCRNHPKEKTYVSSADDFKRSVPEGGCLKPCEFRLNCGHVCEKSCHPTDAAHEKYLCKKKCGKRVCSLGHLCGKRCHFGEPCDKCLKPVNKKIPLCGHIQRVPCSEDPCNYICREKCRKLRQCGHICQGMCGKACEAITCREQIKKVLPCGHEAIVPCYMPVKEFECTEPCITILKCLHKCGGSCSKCKQGRLHRRCEQNCERNLPCSHVCKQKCTKNCPPCSQLCEVRCLHSKCNKKCGEICSPCMENCAWRCRHLQCTNLCHEECNREPCNKQCERYMDCGHRCIGLCGEPCPELCRICNKEEVEEIFFGTEDEPDSLFVLLEDCNHVFEKEGLDTWMNVKDDAAGVVLKKCPKCNTVIRKSVRYGNIIKSIMKDVEKIKEKVAYGNDFNEMREEAYRKCRELNTYLSEKEGYSDSDIQKIQALIENEYLTDFINLKPRESKQDPLSYALAARLYNCNRDHAVRVINQAEFFLNIEKILIKTIEEQRQSGLKNDSPRSYLLKEIESLKTYVLYWNINEEQFDDATHEFKRIKLTIDVFIVFEQLQKHQRFLQSNESRIFRGYIEELLSNKRLNLTFMAKVETLIEALKRKFSCSGLPKEELNMVVKAMGFSKGHWFKCKNGHFYAIGECGGAMETSICPECHETIGGMNHSLAAGNRHAGDIDDSQYAAYSEEANNLFNMDPAELARLQR